MRRRGLARWLPVLAALGLTAQGCKDDDDGRTDDGAGTTTDDGSEEVGTAGTETGDDADDGESTGGDEVVFEVAPVYGVPNLDDDDEDGVMDWVQLVFDGDNDVSSLSIPGVPDGYTVEMTLVGDLEQIRIWHGAGDFLGHGGDPINDTLRFDPGPDGTVLDVEFGEYNASGVLQITLLDPAGAEAQAIDVDIHASPLIMNHHLQPTEHVWVVEMNGNGSMIADLEAVLGDRLTSLPGSQYGGDVWIQDEIEFATSTNADGTRLDTVIDSIRERGLRSFPKNELVYPDSIARMWGNPSNASTFDAFGNLEASPPVTVDGVDYPLGRIYYGKQGQNGLDDVLADHLDVQHVQAPFELNTEWLCVGHIDEVSSFVPDPSSAKGFKLLFSDVPSAYAILDGLDPAMSLPRYAPAWPTGHGIGTVEGITDDDALRAYNEDLQALYLDTIRERFKTELGLEEDDIIDIPTLFEPVNCGPGGPHALALVPGTVNLLVTNLDDTTHLFMPDTFVRSDLSDQSSDPFVQDFAARMPDGLELHFIDNWAVYHMYSGEVHCATNTRRTPAAQWFETAMHLLEN